MPKFLEDRLRQEYGTNDRAVYGTMNTLGAMRGNKETALGRKLQTTHERDQSVRSLVMRRLGGGK